MQATYLFFKVIVSQALVRFLSHVTLIIQNMLTNVAVSQNFNFPNKSDVIFY